MEGLLGFVEGVAGKPHARLLFPGIATIFLYVITNAYMGLLPIFGTIGFIEHGHGHEAEFIPLLRGANTDINLPLSIAIMSLILVETWGMRVVDFFHYTMSLSMWASLGAASSSSLPGQVKETPMNIIFGFVNMCHGLAGDLQPHDPHVDFTFRLFGNITTEKCWSSFSCFLVPMIFTIPFYGSALLIRSIQALIFSGLTLVFATVAISSSREETNKNITKRKNEMTAEVMKMITVGIVGGLGFLGPALALGFIGYSAMPSLRRNPEAEEPS